ncbi:MAG: hypothetical protein ACREMQ_21935 [Longimicrobiales bacterium]
MIAELRATLARRFPDALPLSYRTAITVATGIAELDDLLPNGGLPRGRLTLWAPGGGVTAVLRGACANVIRRGERSAWVDGAGTVAEAWPEGSLLLRAVTEQDALVCAEELLRSGGFALVGLSGASKAVSREAVRLSRAAKVGGSAFVAIGTESALASLRLESRLPPDGYRWRLDPFGQPVEVELVRVEVEARSMGWSGVTSFELPVVNRTVRLAPDPLLVDRRGVLKQPYRRGRDKRRAVSGDERQCR